MTSVKSSEQRLVRLRRASLAALAVSSLLLAGCAAPSRDAGSSSKGSGDSKVATGGAQFSTADKETAKLGSDAKPGQFPRTVKHALGETEIKERPQRVVVLDTGELDDVLSLGITPVGMVTTKGKNAVPSYLADKVKDVKTVGTINELNLEAIAELKPDLIVGSKLRADKVYGQLSDIAPTVFSIRPGFPWKENFLLVADSLGLEKEAEGVLNRYAQRAAGIKKAVKPGTRVSLVRFMPGRIRLYANKSLIGVVLKDAGLARPEKQDVDELAVEVSPENIGEAGGDVLFYSSYGQPDATGQSKVTSGPAWKGLAPVKAGKAYAVEDDVWFLGLGPTGADQILSDLESKLAGK